MPDRRWPVNLIYSQCHYWWWPIDFEEPVHQQSNSYGIDLKRKLRNNYGDSRFLDKLNRFKILSNINLNFNQLILFVSSLNMVALCMARHQKPTHDNWTAFIIQDWDWHWEHSAPAQCPACTQRPTKLLWRNVESSCPCITIWKLVPALTVQHIMPCMNSTEPIEIYMLPGQMGEEAWPDPWPILLVSK